MDEHSKARSNSLDTVAKQLQTTVMVEQKNTKTKNDVLSEVDGLQMCKGVKSFENINDGDVNISRSPNNSSESEEDSDDEESDSEDLEEDGKEEEDEYLIEEEETSSDEIEEEESSTDENSDYETEGGSDSEGSYEPIESEEIYRSNLPSLSESTDSINFEDSLNISIDNEEKVFLAQSSCAKILEMPEESEED